MLCSPRLSRVSASLALALLAACGGGPVMVGSPSDFASGSRPPGTSSSATGSPSSVRIELQGTPVAVFNAATGKTSVVLDFLLRDGSGRSIDPATATFERLVNGNKADVESVPDFKDTKLATNLHLGMVLDASYSMTVGATPAFVPMQKAAYSTLQQIRTQFASWNAGSFTSVPSWFQNEYFCAPVAETAPDEAVLALPVPTPGDATRIFASTTRMVDRLRALHDAAPGQGTSDQFSIVLFTDGHDNYSWFDTSALPARSVTAGGAPFTCGGSAPTSRDDLLARLQAFPQLKVHVIGLGADIQADELAAIAQAGHGRFVSNPDQSQVSALFVEISREFTTVRRDGITMPLSPADYEYVEQVSVGAATSRVRFRFHAGDAGATVRADTIVVE